MVYKKVQFDPIKDGLLNLPPRFLRLMAAYWLGSHDATLQTEAEVLEQLQIAFAEDRDRLQAVLDRLPRRSFDLLYSILSEGGLPTFEELQAVFPLRSNERLRTLLQPLVFRGLVWELRSTQKDELSARLFVLETCRAQLKLPSYLQDKLGAFLPGLSRKQLRELIEILEGETKQLRGAQAIIWLKTQLRSLLSVRRLFESFNNNDKRLLKILSLQTEPISIERLFREFSLFSNDNAEVNFANSIAHLSSDLGLAKSIQLDEGKGLRASKRTVLCLPREVAHIIRYNFKEKYKDVIPPIPVFKPPDEDFALGTKGKERPTLWIDLQQLLNHLIRCEVGVIRKGGMHKKNLKRILDRLEGHPVDAYH
ncbi:MAG: hypothetical protein ABH878_06940, partial [bacterium]